MGDATGIEWTDATWNPIVGCSVVSPGCTNCYAMRMAARLEAMAPKPDGSGNLGLIHYEGTTQASRAGAVWTGKVALAPDPILLAPLRWRRPRRIFVNSMGDLFHESVPDDWIDKVFAVMALAPQHTFQVLTKRSARMREYMTKPHSPGRARTVTKDWRTIDTPAAHVRTQATMCDLFRVSPPDALNRAAHWLDEHGPEGDGFLREWPLPNVWLGVSAEDQPRANERIPDLLATPAAVRFVSAEPLLGRINIERIRKTPASPASPASLGSLHWLIVGGESGPHARPMHPDWARGLRDQCASAGVPFFFKQWGEWAPMRADLIPVPRERQGWLRQDGRLAFVGDRIVQRRQEPRADRPLYAHIARVGKRTAGRHLDGRTHDAFPTADCRLPTAEPTEPA